MSNSEFENHVIVGADGHRRRLKERILNDTNNTIEDYHLLEALLFYAIPVRDTRTESIELLNQFHGLNEIFQASPEELCQIQGIGKTTADFLKYVSWFLTDAKKEEPVYSEITDIAVPQDYDTIPTLLTTLLKDAQEGTYCIALLDAQNRLLFLKKQTIQNNNHRYTTENFRYFLTILSECQNVNNAIIVHRHNQSVLTVDEDDRFMTKRLSQYLTDIHICLQNSYICNSNIYIPI